MDRVATEALWPAADGDDAEPVVEVDGHLYPFPGCCRIHIARSDIDDYDGRIEYWDGASETALMVRAPTSPYHEQPVMRLAALAERIAATRGADIVVLGASDLVLRDAAGNRHRILQADQIVYTRPAASLPSGPAVEIGTGELPDVVLEVDLTTDVRRGKLKLYEKWGFPEVWVEVPERRAPSRPRRSPGLTIHRLEKGGYAQAEESAAFPTWTAGEIHAALNEDRASSRSISVATAAVLRRVGREMRADADTGPDDDPFLREERGEIRAEAVEAIFGLRGLPMSPSLGVRVASLRASMEALVRAAHDCRGEDDFLRRIGANHDRDAR